jgi:hypothetical protein
MLGDVASGWRPLQEEFSFQLHAQFETVSESFMLRQLARSFLAAPWLLPDNGRSRSWRPTPVEGWAFPSQELDEEGIEHGGEDELEEGVMLSKSASVVVTKSAQQARRQEFQQQRQDQEEWGGNRFTSTDDPYSTGTDGGDDFVGDGDETEDETGWQRGSLTGEESAKAEALSDAEAATEEVEEVEEEDETAALEATETEAEAQRSEAELLAQPDATGIVKANGSEVVILYRGDDEEDGALGEFVADEKDGHVANVTAVEKARVRASSGRSGGIDGSMRQHLALCERDWLCVVSASRLRRKARFEQLWLQQPLLMPASGAPRDASGSHPSATAPRANGTALETARVAAAAAASPNASASATGHKVGSATGDPKRNGTDETGDPKRNGTDETGDPKRNGTDETGDPKRNGTDETGDPKRNGTDETGDPKRNGTDETGDPKRNGTDDGIGGGWFALRALDNGRLVQMLPPDDEEAWVIRAAGAVTSAVTSGAAELGGGAFNVAANASAASGLLVVSALELWKQEGLALRNLGTGALLNFRGADIGGDGTSARGHGDTKPRTAAWRRTPRTRFVVEPIPGERRGKPGGFLRKPKRRKKRDPER